VLHQGVHVNIGYYTTGVTLVTTQNTVQTLSISGHCVILFISQLIVSLYAIMSLGLKFGVAEFQS